MFETVRKKVTDVTDNSIDTVIGKDAVITGEISGYGNLRIDGKVIGDISYSGSIIIGETGNVMGNISASGLSVAGKVEGDVEIENLLTVFSSGQLLGNIEAGNLVINTGAIFRGRSNMTAQKDIVCNV